MMFDAAIDTGIFVTAQVPSGSEQAKRYALRLSVSELTAAFESHLSGNQTHSLRQLKRMAPFYLTARVERRAMNYAAQGNRKAADEANRQTYRAASKPKQPATEAQQAWSSGRKAA